MRRYFYCSDRRVKRIAADNNINLENRWRLGLALPIWRAQAQLSRDPKAVQRHEASIRVERAIGQSAVEDFVTPPRAAFVKGCGPLSMAAYTTWGRWGRVPHKGQRKGVIMHTRTLSSSGCRVELCLFGSLENCTDYLSGTEPAAPMWSSSSTRAIEEFVANRGAIPAPIYDDDESIAVEILRVFNNEGMTGKHVFARIERAEWFAEVFHDVELDKDRWNLKPGRDLPEPVDRIVIGWPLWVRTQSR